MRYDTHILEDAHDTPVLYDARMRYDTPVLYDARMRYDTLVLQGDQTKCRQCLIFNIKTV